MPGSAQLFENIVEIGIKSQLCLRHILGIWTILQRRASQLVQVRSLRLFQPSESTQHGLGVEQQCCSVRNFQQGVSKAGQRARHILKTLQDVLDPVQNCEQDNLVCLCVFSV